MTVHYSKPAIAVFQTTLERLFRYMSAGNHRHLAFKSHRLACVAGNVVTLDAEVYNPDGTTFAMRLQHTLDPPRGIETRLTGGAFDGARFTHSYTPIGGRTKVDMEGDFPALPGMSDADTLKMIDGFFGVIFAEDAATLRHWS